LGESFQQFSKNLYTLSPEYVPPFALLETETEEGDFFHLPPGVLILAETKETFHLPDDIYATVHDKSSWIRLGLNIHNTVIEPGWRGILTLEIKNINHVHDIILRPGQGIAQVMFHRLSKTPDNPYEGHYQDQKGVRVS
jgi:dCTP deaminase